MIDFDELACEAGIEVFYSVLPAARAVSLSDAVCLDWSLIGRDRERAICLSHELGHIMTGSLYSVSDTWLDRCRAEVRAERWEIRRLIPEHAFSACLASGLSEPWELAEFFGVPEDLILKAARLYNMTEQ